MTQHEVVRDIITSANKNDGHCASPVSFDSHCNLCPFRKTAVCSDLINKQGIAEQWLKDHPESSGFPKSVTEFVAGHWYRYKGKESLHNWASSGAMNFALLGIPVLCCRGHGDGADFVGYERKDGSGDMWHWASGIENWEEVAPPIEGKTITASTVVQSAKTSLAEVYVKMGMLPEFGVCDDTKGYSGGIVLGTPKYQEHIAIMRKDYSFPTKKDDKGILGHRKIARNNILRRS